MPIKVRVRVQGPRSKSAPYVHTKVRKVEVLVSRKAVLFHSSKGKANCGRGASRGAGEVASDFEPLANHREEGFLSPFRVVDGEGEVVGPNPTNPGAERRAAPQDMGDRLGRPRRVVVPPAVRNQALRMPVFGAHLEPVSNEGAGAA